MRVQAVSITGQGAVTNIEACAKYDMDVWGKYVIQSESVQSAPDPRYLGPLFPGQKQNRSSGDG